MSLTSADAPQVGPIPPAASDTVPACARCGAPIVRRRRAAHQDGALCAACNQRARRAAYFRLYYEANRDRILDKNRRWARDNKQKIVQLRQARRAREQALGEATRRCLDCGTAVVRALRCRRCSIRHRYATDPAYRARRLATTRRWLARRQQARRSGAPPPGAAPERRSS